MRNTKRIVGQNKIVDYTVGKVIASAKITSGNEEITTTPFSYQPIDITYDEHGYERITSKRKRRIIRFCLSEEGDYTVTLYDKEDKLVKTEYFQVIPSKRQAKLHIKYGIAYEKDGKYFLPYGINMAFPEAFKDSNGQEFGLQHTVSFLGLRQYDTWIKKCAQNGINLIRIWCSCSYFSPDKDELGEYDYAQFTKLDKIFEIANKYKVRLKLTLEHFRTFVDDRSLISCEGGPGEGIFRKYATYKGEFPTDEVWLQEEKYRALWIEKLREYQLRYACNPALFAVEFWNEMNAYGDWNIQQISAWNEYMVPFARKLFPNAILLNSLGSLDKPFALEAYNKFPFDKFDWLQFHSYFDQGAYYPELGYTPIEGIKKAVALLQDKQRECGKPMFLAETGAVNDCHSSQFRYYAQDDKGLMLVDCVYTPLFLGCLGPGNIWHWDERYVCAKNLYKYYKPLADVVKDVDFPKENFTPIDISNDKVYCFVLKGKNNYLAFIRNKEYNWKNILRDQKKVGSINTAIDFSLIGASGVQSIKIWQQEKGKAEISAQKLCLKNLKYGLLLRGEIF